MTVADLRSRLPRYLTAALLAAFIAVLALLSPTPALAAASAQTQTQAR